MVPRMSHRRPPFYTCGVSFSEIAFKAYKKAKDFNGPTSSVMNKMVKLASLVSPLIIAVQHYIFAILSFIDNKVLAAESVVEASLPPSKHLFDKVDDVVLIVEKLPGRFDNAVNKIPEVIHRVPVLDWALNRAIAWFSFLLSVLNDRRSRNTEEKDIVIDISCDKVNTAFQAEEEGVGNRVNAESANPGENPEAEYPKISYEALQKGIRGGEQEPRDNVSGQDLCESGDSKADKIEESSSSKDDDRILLLFEESWLSMSKPA